MGQKIDDRKTAKIINLERFIKFIERIITSIGQIKTADPIKTVDMIGFLELPLFWIYLLKLFSLFQINCSKYGLKIYNCNNKSTVDFFRKNHIIVVN